MTQVNNSNITFNSLKNMLGISTSNIKFSDFRKVSTDTVKPGIFSLSTIANKYRVYLPSDNTNLIIWYDASSIVPLINITLNSFLNTYKKFNNPFVINNYGFNGKQCFVLSNNQNYITDVIQNTSFTFCFVLYSTTNISSIFYNGSNLLFKILFDYYNSNNFNINHPCILIINTKFENITVGSTTTTNIKIITRINGISINTYDYNEITVNNLNNIKIDNTCIFFSNFVGNISEILIYNTYLDLKTIEYIESYLSSKWFGIPSYCLPTTHIFYKVPILNIDTSPIILYNFYNNNNYGTYGSHHDLTLNVNYQSKTLNYYVIDSLQPLLWFKFDDNIDNYGYTSSLINLLTIDGNASYSTNNIKGDKSINLNNMYCKINLPSSNTFYSSDDFTLLFWFCINGSVDNGLNIYTLFTIFYVINNATTKLELKNNPNGSLILSINSLIISDNVFKYDNINNTKIWQNVCISMKKNGLNDMKINIYYNSVLIYSDVLVNNFLFINKNIATTILINETKQNILYDDFRIYNKALTTLEIQDIFQYPISRQSGTLIPNTYGYKWSLNTFIENNYLNVNNYFDITNQYLTINFNLTIFNSAIFNFINILYISNYLDISLFYFNKDVAIKYYLKILIKNSSQILNFSYFPLNNLLPNINNNYFIKINFTNNNINFYFNNIEIIKDSSTSFNDSIIGSRILDDTNNVFYIGNYLNTTYINSSTIQFQLENFQIYNKLLNVITNVKNINYSSSPTYYYYDYKNYNIKYPFSFVNLNYNNIPYNYLGLTNINAIVNYYNNLGYTQWINNINFFNIKNGFYIFVVPTSGYYNFILAGACGGFSSTNKTITGNGIISYFNCYLEVSTILYIGTGFKGGDGGNPIELYSGSDYAGKLNLCGGGGGLSFIYDKTNSRLLTIVGGGGGNGVNYNGLDALIITNGGKNNINITTGLEASGGNGGNRGVYSLATGYGAGGGGYLSDGVTSENFNGISLLSILNSDNKLNLPNYNYGGLGGFPCGATGGVNLNFNIKVWGGGGGGGYSGGMGGAGDNFNNISGGGGGGSYDINGINNEITLFDSLGNNGYNSSNGYVNIKLLTKDTYLSYTGSSITVKNGLVLLHEINNNKCFNYDKLKYYLINQIDGSTSKIVNNININLSSIITFFTANTTSSYLLINNRLNLKSISIFYKVYSNNSNLNIISNIASYEYFLNNFENPNLTELFNTDLLNWKFITIKSNNILDNITLFKNIEQIDVKLIIGYNRIISFDEHLINYNKYNI
jgi:hypothetical protein